MPEQDLIVVGAGPSGLIAAHTWLELHPEDEVLVLESSSELGGSWSRSRVFPTLMTQTPIGMLEFSSYPMQQLPQHETFHGFFPAKHVTSYINDFSTHKSFASKTIKDRVLFESPVRLIEKVFNLWNIETANGQSFFTKKLIIATGLTSQPNLPNLRLDLFTPPLIHSRDLAAQAPFLSSPDIKNVTVLGSGKSAFDAISLLQSFQTPPAVHWLIRSTGHGPAPVATVDSPWPFSNSHKTQFTRFFSKLSPSIFEPLDSWTKFWHRNKAGIWIADRVWKGIDSKWKRTARYERNAEIRNLKPTLPAFWSSDKATVYNAPRMWDEVSNITILQDDIESLHDTDIILKSNKRIECDAIIAATGWLNTYLMFSDNLATDLGLPLSPNNADAEITAEWEIRIGKSMERVINKFPRLARAPNHPTHRSNSTPSRLYRNIVPCNDDDHSIAFIGTVGTTHSFQVAEVQALWATSYLDGEMDLPSTEEMKEDVALTSAWRRRRYLGDGDELGFEWLQYTGMLLRDLGLNDLRKGGGWREMFRPYCAADFRGILGEWRARRKEMGESVHDSE